MVILKQPGKIYLKHLTTLYEDYDIYVLGNDIPKEIYICNAMYSRYAGDNIDKKCDRNFQINDGMKAYVAQPCKYSVDAIRKNYSIKRSPDSGDFNVFSKADLSSSRMNQMGGNGYIWGCGIYVSEKNKLVVLDNTLSTYQYAKMKEMSPSELLDLKDSMRVFHNIDVSDLRYVDWTNIYDMSTMPTAYYLLLTKQLTKPAVYVDWLNFDTGNKLTSDVLLLVLNACKANYTGPESFEHMVTELSALNQYDWRKYPYTMRMLGLLATYDTKYVYYHANKNASRFPKAIEALVQTMNDKDNETRLPETKADWQMGKEIVDKLLGSVVRFSTPNGICEKLYHSGLLSMYFDKYYTQLVKITPKEFE